MTSSGQAGPAVLVPREPSTERPSEDPATGPARNPRLLELGVGLIVVALPLAFLPMSATPFVDVKIAVLLLGCLFVWAGSAPADRTLALLAENRARWAGLLRGGVPFTSPAGPQGTTAWAQMPGAGEG